MVFWRISLTIWKIRTFRKSFTINRLFYEMIIQNNENKIKMHKIIIGIKKIEQKKLKNKKLINIIINIKIKFKLKFFYKKIIVHIFVIT